MRPLIDVGNGPPLVLIPGLQGRWEWMRPTVNALARTFRVISFTLAGDWGSGVAFDERLGFDNFIVQIDRVLEEAGIESADFCGVSYGGLIALRYAAMRPERVRHLVLASALPPDYETDDRYRFYRRAPVLMLPLFVMASAHRVSPELRAALPTFRARLQMVPQVFRVIAAPVWPRHMRRRMELIRTVDFLADVRQVRAPALAITGEPGLDRTVPVELTRRYLDCLPGTEHVVLERTGHMGTVTRPAVFASIVSSFVLRATPRRDTAGSSRMVG
jgi:pimeloyl-ACP methyl ester carboxylesterase